MGLEVSTGATRELLHLLHVSAIKLPEPLPPCIDATFHVSPPTHVYWKSKTSSLLMESWKRCCKEEEEERRLIKDLKRYAQRRREG